MAEMGSKRAFIFAANTAILKSPKMNITSGNTTMAPPTKRQRLSAYQLGLPKPILYYLKMNANSKLLLKFMKVSRYFWFKEFPYTVVKDLKYDGNNWIYRNGKYCFNSEILDLQNLAKPLWITEGINCYTEDIKLISRLLSKAVFCDIKHLRLEDQIITLDEFIFLISSGNVKTCTFSFSHVVYENGGEIVPIDEILKLIPNVSDFRWCLDLNMPSPFTSETTQKLIDAINPSMLSTFCIMNIPETFDFQLFAKFMSKNPSIDYFLDFDILISREYSKILQAFADKVIKTSATKYSPIQLRFPRQTEKSIEILKDLYEKFGFQRHSLIF